MANAPANLTSRQRRRPRAAHRVLRFALTSCLFLAGLAVASWAAEGYVGRELIRTRGDTLFGHPGLNRVGGDAAQAVRRARLPGPGVHTIVLGDSVCRQLFHPGKEPDPAFRFVPSNYVVTVPGQAYMLDATLKRCPAVKDVYLFYFPGSLGNDLRVSLTRDYLCGFFHEPKQVIEVFKTCRDASLLSSHVGRMIWPNLLTLNSATHVAEAAAGPRPGVGAPGAYQQLPADQEPILEYLSDHLGREPAYRQLPGATGGPDSWLVLPSRTSAVYIERMRVTCAAKGIRFHLLAVPVSDQFPPFTDTRGVLDGPILFLPKDLYADGTHFKLENVAAARRRMVEHYKLDPRLAAVKP